MDRPQRDAVVERDAHTCAACGCRTSGQVHHLLPRGQGGSDEPYNLLTLCGYCHMLVSPIRVDVMTRLFGIDERELLVWKARVEAAISRRVLSDNGATGSMAGRPRVVGRGRPKDAARPVRPRSAPTPTPVPAWKRERPRAGCVWLPEEDEELLAEVRAGLTLADIARRRGRGTFAVEVRLCKLGVDVKEVVHAPF